MKTTGCCGPNSAAEAEDSYETVRIAKAKGNCRLCDDYAERHHTRPVAVICCEGACLRGEVARQAANMLCHTIAPQKNVRICLGGAFTKDTGQRDLVRQAPRLIALEGCFTNCASRMMAGVIDGLTPEIIIADRLYDFDRNLFGVEEMAPAEIQAHARTVAEKVAAGFDLCEKPPQGSGELNCREWLEAVDAPLLLMQSNPRQVVSANKKALALFEKELHDVAGQRGGQVFDCFYAFTEAGCGKDSHCEGCKIRDGIIDTFATGKPHRGVATSLQIKKSAGTVTYELQVSAEKVGELALVKIERFARV